MIRTLIETDIPGLNNLPPIDWNADYEAFLEDFLKDDFFKAFVLILNESIVGTGNVLIKENIGWLANIIVAENCRGQGFGTTITKFLVDYIWSKGCKTQLLLASNLGEPIYLNVGFRKTSDYKCFVSEKELEYIPHQAVRKLKQTDLSSILELDKLANGENRLHLIGKYFLSGWGFFMDKKDLLGVYIPDFGRGLVLALEAPAGRELLKLKHSEKNRTTFLPSQNKLGIEFLKNIAVEKETKLSRMVLGKENQWNPRLIYSYGSGHCG